MDPTARLWVGSNRVGCVEGGEGGVEGVRREA
jgi:hypothetical protein